jgi:hypothetical protein
MTVKPIEELMLDYIYASSDEGITPSLAGYWQVRSVGYRLAVCSRNEWLQPPSATDIRYRFGTIALSALQDSTAKIFGLLSRNDYRSAAREMYRSWQTICEPEYFEQSLVGAWPTKQFFRIQCSCEQYSRPHSNPTSAGDWWAKHTRNHFDAALKRFRNRQGREAS